MIVAIVGSRDLPRPYLRHVRATIEKFKSEYGKELRIISGRGGRVDWFVESAAHAMGIDFKPYPARWDLFGLAAGPLRNREMAEAADAVIAFRAAGKIDDGSSNGTDDMLSAARAAGCIWTLYHFNEDGEYEISMGV